VGFFDSRLGPGAAGFSEDTEYSIRIRNAGFKIGYTPGAIVYHELNPKRYGHPFLPLLLLCDPEDELDHPTLLMADTVLRHPISAAALLDALDLLLTETLRERVFRKSGHVALR
jgi:hypothetical protein